MNKSKITKQKKTRTIFYVLFIYIGIMLQLLLNLSITFQWSPCWELVPQVLEKLFSTAGARVFTSVNKWCQTDVSIVKGLKYYSIYLKCNWKGLKAKISNTSALSKYRHRNSISLHLSALLTSNSVFRFIIAFYYFCFLFGSTSPFSTAIAD